MAGSITKLKPVAKLNNIGTAIVENIVKNVNSNNILLGLDFVI